MSNLKEAFVVESKHGAFYTGGSVKWSRDGEYLYCQNDGAICILSIDKGMVVMRLGDAENCENEDTINSFTLNNDGDQVVTHHKSGLFKLWSQKEGKIIKMWKSIHNGPVPQIALYSNNLIMASGGSDSSVRIWDLEHHACIYNLKGVQGVISVLEFHPNSDIPMIFAAGDDTKICAWDINTGQLKTTLSGHFSRITCLSFHKNGIHLLSSGRDKVLILWDIVKQAPIRILPVYEGIEGIFILSTNIKQPIAIDVENGEEIFAVTAGEKGKVKIWEMRSGREIYCQDNSLLAPAKEDGGLSIIHLLFNDKLKCFAVVSVDHAIIIYSLESFQCTKQFVGYTDEILDVVYVGANDSHLAVATNSCDIKLYELSTMCCQLLRGHIDLVLSLAITPSNCNLMLSSAKDNSIRVWLMCTETNKMFCIGSAIRHTASIGSVALSQALCKFFASVSQDMCLKLWELPGDITITDRDVTLNATHTVMAHSKDINCVTISPNDKLLATGSQDKTAKLWSTDNLQLLGVLRGHRRGIWCVRFSPIDQVLLTSSADCTIKLWSLTELNCLKTFEGHESSVLRAEFISRGMQLITSSADGLLKLWNVKTSECASTFEQHDNRVWALAISKNEEHIISGGSDSLIVVWRDVTQENRTRATAECEHLILEEQKLSNLLKANELIAALKLALKLEKPLQVLRVIEGIIGNNENAELSIAIGELKSDYKVALLKCASIWNTNSRNSHVAQLVINALLNDIGSGNLHVNDLSSSMEALIPYTERHFKRLTRLLQDLHLINYTVNCIKPHNEPILIEKGNGE